MVEARGEKPLRNPENPRAGRSGWPGSQLAETAQQLAIPRDCSWFVRHDS
jgi:hypothetical protein